MAVIMIEQHCFKNGTYQHNYQRYDRTVQNPYCVLCNKYLNIPKTKTSLFFTELSKKKHTIHNACVAAVL